MIIKKTIPIFVLIFFTFSCKKDVNLLPENSLERFIQKNDSIQLTYELIACSASQLLPNGIIQDNIFFYPIDGATDFNCFIATEDLIDSMAYNRYRRVDLYNEGVFNGYLWKFVQTSCL